MCDYHSILVTGNGEIFHCESNSHLAMRLKFFADRDQKVWEAEYNPLADDTGAAFILERGNGPAPSVAIRAVERHYDKLVALHKAKDYDRKLIPPFDSEDYSDVRRYLVAVNGWTLEQAGYDPDGYDMDGYDMDGYDRDGYGPGGYDMDGYDRDGYGPSGYDPEGYDRDGYDPEGYDINGYNRKGEPFSDDN